MGFPALVKWTLNQRLKQAPNPTTDHAAFPSPAMEGRHQDNVDFHADQFGCHFRQLLDHFEHPRNAGDLPDGHAHVRVDNPACGDILELFVRLEGDSIDAITFRAKGCVPLMVPISICREFVPESCNVLCAESAASQSKWTVKHETHANSAGFAHF